MASFEEFFSIVEFSTTLSLTYQWPKSVIKQLEMACCNFIWTGDIFKHASRLSCTRFMQHNNIVVAH